MVNYDLIFKGLLVYAFILSCIACCLHIEDC